MVLYVYPVTLSDLALTTSHHPIDHMFYCLSYSGPRQLCIAWRLQIW